MSFIKRNITLLLGLLIPVGMVVLVAASVYLPGFFIKPHTNFLYSIGDNTYNCQKFSVSRGKVLIADTSGEKCDAANTPRLYTYDVSEKKSTEVAPETAAALTVNDMPESPDGFSITTGSSGGGFLFFYGSSRDYNSQYLVGHGYSDKLSLPQSGNYYNQFRFLGWITQ
ncbi:MAG: hypothetical protein JWO43_647 [Candidatus Adlerbacteria bacterium]|nr:hypothetical protein [Candidatus Adlerbacteria bacterium]